MYEGEERNSFEVLRIEPIEREAILRKAIATLDSLLCDSK